MDIKQLKIFCTVADKKSFSLAAEAMGLTQPTISFQIASLEQELGAKLLDRGGRVTTLTQSGEVLYRYAVQVLDLTAEAEHAINKLQGLLGGQINLGASTIPGEYILPELLQRFREIHPGIDINLYIGDTKNILKKVVEGEVEIGVVGATERNEKLTFRKFVTDRLVLIVPAENQWQVSDSISLGDLERIPFVLREEGSGTRTVIEQKLKSAGFDPSGLNIAMTMGSTASVKTAVESGAGASIVSSRAVRNEVRLGLMREVEVQGLEMDRDFFVVCRKHKVLSPASEALLGFLE